LGQSLWKLAQLFWAKKWAEKETIIDFCLSLSLLSTLTVSRLLGRTSGAPEDECRSAAISIGGPRCLLSARELQLPLAARRKGASFVTSLA